MVRDHWCTAEHRDALVQSTPSEIAAGKRPEEKHPMALVVTKYLSKLGRHPNKLGGRYGEPFPGITSYPLCRTGNLKPGDEGYFYYHTRMFTPSGKLEEHVVFDCSNCKHKMICLTDSTTHRIYEEV